MNEQIDFPFIKPPQPPEKQFDLPHTITPAPKEAEQLNLDFSAKEPENLEPDLTQLDRKALEELYFAKINKHRFHGLTDDQIRDAVRDPQGELDRLAAIDRQEDSDPWADINPSIMGK